MRGYLIWPSVQTYIESWWVKCWILYLTIFEATVLLRAQKALEIDLHLCPEYAMAVVYREFTGHRSRCPDMQHATSPYIVHRDYV